MKCIYLKYIYYILSRDCVRVSPVSWKSAANGLISQKQQHMSVGINVRLRHDYPNPPLKSAAVL